MFVPVTPTYGQTVQRLQHQGVHQDPNHRRVSPEPDFIRPGFGGPGLFRSQGSARYCEETGCYLLALCSKGQEHHGHQTLKQLSIYVISLFG